MMNAPKKADQLRAFMEENEYNQKKIAQDLHVTQSDVSNYLNNYTRLSANKIGRLDALVTQLLAEPTPTNNGADDRTHNGQGRKKRKKEPEEETTAETEARNMELLKQEMKDNYAKLKELDEKVQGFEAQVTKSADAVTKEHVNELIDPIAKELGDMKQATEGYTVANDALRATCNKKLDDIKQATEGYTVANDALRSTCDSLRDTVHLLQTKIANLERAQEEKSRAQEEKSRAQEDKLRTQGKMIQDLLGMINRTREKMLYGFYLGAVFIPGLKKLKEHIEGAGTSTQGGAYIPSAPGLSH